MTRDLYYYFEKDITEVFQAFRRAAYEKFGKDCSEQSGRLLVFGLNFSFKYNMNGGAIKVFFVPYNTGTAVNLHYIIAQLWGARYGAHAKELISYVEKLLLVYAREINLPLNMFLSYVGQPNDTDQPSVENPSTPVQQQPVYVPTQSIPAAKSICSNCGNPVAEGSAFCRYCGQDLRAAYCSQCGRPYGAGDAFCAYCGKKR